MTTMRQLKRLEQEQHQNVTVRINELEQAVASLTEEVDILTRVVDALNTKEELRQDAEPQPPTDPIPAKTAAAKKSVK